MSAQQHDMVHDDEPTRTPTHPTMASAFDRLVDANLELVAAVRELVTELRADRAARRGSP